MSDKQFIEINPDEDWDWDPEFITCPGCGYVDDCDCCPDCEQGPDTCDCE